MTYQEFQKQIKNYFHNQFAQLPEKMFREMNNGEWFQFLWTSLVNKHQRFCLIFDNETECFQFIGFRGTHGYGETIEEAINDEEKNYNDALEKQIF